MKTIKDHQTEQLNEWKNVLLPEVFSDLLEYINYHNQVCDGPDDRRHKRGTDLDNFIGNYMMGWRYVNGEIDYENKINK